MVANELKASECVKRPSSCTEAEMDDFRLVVMLGGQVTPFRLKSRIRAASLLGFHYEGLNLAAVAALKAPADRYRDKIFRNAGVAREREHYHVELGWAVTLKPYRGKGLCTELANALIRRLPDENIFATTATDNLGMRHLLTGCGFTRIGKSFVSEAAKRSIELWVLRRE